MDGKAVENIAALAKAPRELNGFILRPNDWVADDPAALVKPGPSAKTLATATLGAVRDYLKANRDKLDLNGLVIHVAGPAAVHVLGPLDARARVRETFVAAECADLTSGFLGKFMSLEDFIVGVQVRFTESEERKRLLALLGNVKHEQVKTSTDDGVTQTVTARAGVTLVTDVAVPNPVTLSGFRTFRDITQPSSPFVVRVQGQSSGLPQVGLFEADGGAWRLTAIGRIHDWLVEALPDIAVLA